VLMMSFASTAFPWCTSTNALIEVKLRNKSNTKFMLKCTDILLRDIGNKMEFREKKALKVGKFLCAFLGRVNSQLFFFVFIEVLR